MSPKKAMDRDAMCAARRNFVERKRQAEIENGIQYMLGWLPDSPTDQKRSQVDVLTGAYQNAVETLENEEESDIAAREEIDDWVQHLLGWLPNSPIEQKWILREEALVRIYQEVVETVKKEAARDFVEFQLQNEIDDCFQPLLGWLPDSSIDQLWSQADIIKFIYHQEVETMKKEAGIAASDPAEKELDDAIQSLVQAHSRDDILEYVRQELVQESEKTAAAAAGPLS